MLLMQNQVFLKFLLLYPNTILQLQHLMIKKRAINLIYCLHIPLGNYPLKLILVFIKINQIILIEHEFYIM